jgi:hypothetical protein
VNLGHKGRLRALGALSDERRERPEAEKKLRAFHAAGSAKPLGTREPNAGGAEPI